MLVLTVVIEPSRADDRVRHSAGAHQPFRPALPVVHLGRAVVRTFAIRNSDRSHECDSHLTCPERGEDVAHAAVVYRFRSRPASAVRTMREDNRINTVQCGRKRLGTREIANHSFSLRRMLSYFGRAAH